LGRAEALEQSGQLEAAMKVYQEVVRQDPGSSEAQTALGRAYYRSGRFQEAETCFERALGIHPDDPDIQRWLTLSYLRAEEPQKVISLLAPEAGDHDRAWVHMLLARAYDAQDRTDEAIGELHRSLALDPRLPEAHFAIGFIAWSTRDLVNAEKEFRKELSLNPRHTASWYYLSDALATEGRLAEAETILKKLVQDAPNSYLTHFGLGKMEERKDNPRGASEHFRRAIELEPNHPEAHYRLAKSLRKLGLVEQAKKAFQRSRELQSCSERVQTPHGMGRSRLRLPDPED
jgi:tetratricopeptide (TPR) repeat protein